jgi:hypothetical protein
VLVDIADRRDLDVRMRGDLPDMVSAAAAHADDGHANAIIRAHYVAGLKHGSRAGANLQEISAIEHGSHRIVSFK